MSQHHEVVVGAYQDLNAAQQDFEAISALVKAREIKVEGVLLVEHHEDGEVTIVSTADHVGRHGLAWGTGVGLVVGLLQPELLAAAAVGAVGGGVIGKFADHRLKHELGEKLGEALPPGAAGIITVARAEDRLKLEQAMPGTPAKSVVHTDERGLLLPLKDSLAEAMHKFAPDRSKLPIPDRPFGGVAGRTLKDSVPDWAMIPGPAAPEGAPNVLLVLIDDAGFGAPDTFGGPVRTPNFTRVREAGAAYNRFHVTAVCSPTRAALLTGRNQHRVGFGSIAEYPGPFPGYTAAKPKSCAGLPRILSENGYVTGGFGKWHLTPNNVQGAAGPFDHWPKSWGFDHWWGFLSGAAGQYDPIITMDDAIVGIPQGKDGDTYYFPDDLTDKAVEWLHAVRAQDAAKPWMMYYSTGCAHAPHHVAPEWADRYRGVFDDGWDALRERTLERQKQLGIVPPDTELTPRPDLFPAWDSLSDNQKRLYVRQMEVYAGFQENADWNVGRLLDEVEQMGDLDNTLVFYIWGDNGASMEGTTTGSFNEMTFLNGIVLDADHQLELIEHYGGIEAIGGEHTAPHVAAAWAHAMNTPFQWGKQMASHLGGTRDPMAVAWPRLPASRSQRASTASRRNRWTGRACSTPSTSPTRPSGTPCSTSRCSAAAPCTPTVGGRPPSPTASPGTSRRRRSPASAPTPTGTPTATPRGSSTTSPPTSRKRTTSPPSTPTRSPSCRSSGGQRPSATGCCRCGQGRRSCSGSSPRSPRRRPSRSRATCRTCSEA